MPTERKIAVLGDIHANADALQVVLDDAQAQGANEFICVGDIVGYNACPNECCDAIRSLGCPVVCGNHDYYCAGDADLSDFNETAAAVVQWTREQLSLDNLNWLRALPYTATARGILIVHATLDMPENWGYVFESTEASPSFNYQRTQVCFHGHTHVPVVFDAHDGVVDRLVAEDMTLAMGHKYFINTGSVGQPRDGDPRASYCLYEPASRKLTFRRLDYDVATAQARIRAAYLPERLAARLELGR